MSFNRNHKRHIYMTFKHLEQLLSQAAARLDEPQPDTQFQEYIPDASPRQRHAINKHLLHLRAVMTRFLQDQEIPMQEPSISALHSYRTALTFAHIALDELMPEHLAAYGTVNDAGAREIRRIVPELRAVLRHIGEALNDDGAETNSSAQCTGTRLP